MRIVKIEFENLNSLKGYWCIDFSHPDYKKNHDLFVISGQTGSGKTTILDAITLALYGRTPRQENAKGKGKDSWEELMTRHTANLMARVTYICRKGNFESTFQIRKARGSVTGSMQNPDCSIKNLDTGMTVYEGTAASKFAEETASTIQLNYEEFCRSIMLAQGEFDRFIKGDERERSEILAKLNGTQNYKQFAAELWEKANNEIKRIDDLKRGLESIEILPEERVKELKDNYSAYEKKAESARKDLEADSKILAWHEKKEGCEKEKSVYEQERNEFLLKREEFKEKEKLLERLDVSFEIESDYNRYCDAEKACRELKAAFEAQKIEAEARADSYKNVLEIRKEALKRLDEFKKTHEEKVILWEKVSKLDAVLKPEKQSFLEAEKRFKEAQEEFKSKESEVIKEQKELDVFLREQETDKEYLSDFKDDEKLSKLVPVLMHRKKSLEDLKEKAFKLEETLNKEKQKLSESEKQRLEVFTRLRGLEEKLKDYISVEYQKVAQIIRDGLKEGQACPVCGGAFHGVNGGEQCDNKVQSTVLEYTAEIKELSENHERLSAEVFARKKTVENLERENASVQEEYKKAFEEFNKEVNPFKLEVKEDLLNLDSVLEKLEDRSREFEKVTSRVESTVKQLEKSRTKIASIDLSSLEKRAAEAEKEFTEKEAGYKKTFEERRKLFGEKSVEADQKEEDSRAAVVEAEFENALKREQELKNEVTECETRFTETQKSLSEADKKYALASEKLNSLLKEKSFESVDDFKKIIERKGELASLKNEKERLKTLEDTTAANLERIEAELSEIEKAKPDNREKADVLAESEELKKIIEEARDGLADIKLKLSQNEDNSRKLEAKKKEIENSQAEKEKWKNVQKIIGIKDGSEFEIFVQSLAFRNVLEFANRYIKDITGKYSLVQIPEKVDFLVHDENYPDPKDDRTVVNMSGGEKFIISLSFALAIAELASRNVQVDSLFLDEGFGTLSGEPLTQAINALKSLQTKGKMLGIITHIEAVIKEFDQKIEAVKKAGGRSILKGSGITGDFAEA